MIENCILISNNELCCELASRKIETFIDENMLALDILKKARDHIHRGYKLLTHPLHSSLKPNETPFRTVIIAKGTDQIDLYSLELIEQAIHSYEKFLNISPLRESTEQNLKDFRLIDFDLINKALK